MRNWDTKKAKTRHTMRSSGNPRAIPTKTYLTIVKDVIRISILFV